MTPRRIRKARAAAQRPAIVIQVPEAIDRETGDHIRRIARRACPGRSILVLSRGITAVTA